MVESPHMIAMRRNLKAAELSLTQINDENRWIREAHREGRVSMEGVLSRSTTMFGTLRRMWGRRLLLKSGQRDSDLKQFAITPPAEPRGG